MCASRFSTLTPTLRPYLKRLHLLHLLTRFLIDLGHSTDSSTENPPLIPEAPVIVTTLLQHQVGLALAAIHQKGYSLTLLGKENKKDILKVHETANVLYVTRHE